MVQLVLLFHTFVYKYYYSRVHRVPAQYTGTKPCIILRVQIQVSCKNTPVLDPTYKLLIIFKV